MSKKQMAIIAGLALLVFLIRFGGKIQWPFGGGQETSTTAGQLNYVPLEWIDYLRTVPGFDPSTIVPGGVIPRVWVQELYNKYPSIAGSADTPRYFPPTGAGAGANSAMAPTYTPQPTKAPTRTPTPIVMRPMTGTATIAFPPASALVMKGNENSLPVHVNVGGKELSSSYWAKFDGSCGSLWCRGPLQMVVPITGTFTLPPTLAVVNGEISYQAADVGSNYDLAKLSFDVSLNAPTSKDMKFGDETGVTEIWTVGKSGDALVLLKVRIQRWDAVNLQLTPLEMVVSFSVGDVPGFVGPVTPTATPTTTSTPTATKPAAKNPTPTPTKGR